MQNVETKRSQLQAAYRDLEALQTKMEDGGLNEAEGARASDLVAEATRLQSELEQYDAVKGLATKGREFPTREPLPAANASRDERKSVRTTPGEIFVTSPAYAKYVADGMPQSWSGSVEVYGVPGQKVELSGKSAERFLEQKTNAIPVLGDNAIVRNTFDDDVPRFIGEEILNLRALFGNLPVSTDVVRFARHTATNRGAAAQDGRGAAKGYTSLEFAAATVPVETIPALSKVAEQDLQDAPRLLGTINGELSLNVRQETEQQLLWGDGNDGKLVGIFDDAAVLPLAPARIDASDDTLLDILRKMRTDIRMNRATPTAIAISPSDWETVELTKGGDEHYIWAVVQTELGPRVWGLPIVEVDSLENPDTGERRILMGDFLRGATVYDRQSITMAVGYVDDDFARNLRTLRVEQRLALAMKRPYAFRYHVTAEAES